MKALGLVLVLAISGCASTAPYKDALGRFQTAGRAIEPHLKPAGDESVQALYDAFHAAINEPIK